MFRVAGTADGFDAIDSGTGSFDAIRAQAANTAIGLQAVYNVEQINANGFAGVYVTGDGSANTFSLTGTLLTGICLVGGVGGDDWMVGSGGADDIRGGPGADRLAGWIGADLLRGDAGADRFQYYGTAESTATTRNRIVDFTQADGDRLDLVGIDADAGTAGDQAFVLVGGAAFSGVAGELRYALDGAGDTLVQADTNGDATADFELVLAGAITLTAADHML